MPDEGTIHEANVYQVVAGLRGELRMRWENQQQRDAEVRKLLETQAADCLRRGLLADENHAALSKIQGSLDTLTGNVSTILSRPRNPNGTRNGWHQRPIVIGGGGVGVGGAVAWFLSQLI